MMENKEIKDIQPEITEISVAGTKARYTAYMQGIKKIQRRNQNDADNKGGAQA